MSHEFSIMAIITATIILLAAVCGVIFWGLSQSNQIADMGYSFITDVDKTSQNEAVRTITAWQDKGLPAAACYTFLKDNPNLITKLTCNICNKVSSGTAVGDCLKNHMHGRVKLILTEEESGGTYTAVMNGG